MSELSSIFLPADFSVASREALALARSLAAPTKATVEVVHVPRALPAAMRAVLFPYAGFGSDEVVIAAELRDQTTKALRRHLHLKRDKGDRTSVDVRMVGADTTVTEVLIDLLRQSPADLVVLGDSPGLQGTLGAQVEGVIAASTRPAIVARDLGGNVTIKRVAVALDLSEASAAAYLNALELAVTHHAALDVLTVVPLPASHGIEGVVAGAIKSDPAGLKKRGQRELKKMLTRLTEELQDNFPLAARRRQVDEHTEVLVGDPEMEILRTLSERETQVLVVGRGGGAARLPLRIGRRARTLAAVAPCHVLLVP